MDRRTFLAAASGVFVIRPAGAFSVRPVPLLTALADACDAGKPLLVIVAPIASVQTKREIGREWARFLMQASTEGLADLALCEVVWASSESCERFLARILEAPSAVPAFLVETDEWRGVPLASIHDLAHERRGLSPVELLEGELRRVLAPDAETLRRRTRQAAEHFTPTELRDLHASLADPSFEQIRTAPALFRLAAEEGSSPRDRVIDALAEDARSRLVLDGAPHGAYWARVGGCGGERLEDGRVLRKSPGPCGTGSVPGIARRFLVHYTDVPLELR